MTYHQFAVDIFPTKLELSVPHKSDDIIFPGSLAAGYAIYQNLDHFGFIEIGITYMNYCEISDIGKKCELRDTSKLGQI